MMRHFLTLFTISAAFAIFAKANQSTTTTPPSLTTTIKPTEVSKNVTIQGEKKIGNTSLVVAASNEVSSSSSRLTSFMEDEELLTAGKESLKVLIKSLRDNRSLDEALAVAITTFATSRTANRIREKSLKSSKMSLDKDFGEQDSFVNETTSRAVKTKTSLTSTDVTKTLGGVALGSLAVLPPYLFPKYFRSMDENWLNENRQIQKFLTNTLIGASE